MLGGVGFRVTPPRTVKFPQKKKTQGFYIELPVSSGDGRSLQ